MTENIVTGNFDAETFWRSNGHAVLPSISDKNTAYVNESMQELLFVFCGPDDLLITRTPFSASLKEYLREIGYDFMADSVNVSGDAEPANADIISLIEKYGTKREQDFKGSKLKLFAPLPNAANWCEKNAAVYDQPDLNIVIKANSKEFSCDIRRRLGIDYESFLAENSDELYEKALSFLKKQKSFLIKDLLGVSGKGNILISSEAILNRVCRYLRKQESEGKACRFLLEELLDKDFDFSCVAEIEKDGKVKISVPQVIRIENLAYRGTVTPNSRQLRMAEESGYYGYIENACKILFEEGYYGFVCFDSMCLKDGGIVPIVEINARCSMSQIKNRIDGKFQKPNQVSLLNYIYINNGRCEDYKNNLFSNMKDILFRGSGGVIPVSSNTVYIDGSSQNKGKFYYYILADSENELNEYEQKVKELSL